MISVLPGQWMIRSITVNSRPASIENGFQQLIFTDGLLRIEPAGITMNVSQSTAKSAVLESCSQIFFADYSTRGDTLFLKLTRPQFAETVSITAILDRELSVN
jgi:hypothetical protein